MGRKTIRTICCGFLFLTFIGDLTSAAQDLDTSAIDNYRHTLERREQERHERKKTFKPRFWGVKTYDECIRKYIPATKTPIASRIVHSTCNDEFKDFRGSKDDRDYYDCIRKELTKAETDMAARALNMLCRSEHGK